MTEEKKKVTEKNAISLWKTFKKHHSEVFQFCPIEKGESK